MDIYISDVEYMGGHCLRVCFEDGEVRIADLYDFIVNNDNPYIKQYYIEALFKERMEHDPNCIDWDNNLTISAESIYNGEFTPPPDKGSIPDTC